MDRIQRHELFARLRAANPEPTTELAYASTFQLLIAVILSAQATDKSVNLATCRQLLEQHGGEVPHSRTALEALPGVGRKTANVVLNTAFGEATIAVDTHIFRLFQALTILTFA